MIKSEAGAALVIYLLIVAAVGLLLSQAVASYTQSLENTKQVYMTSEDRRQIENELQVLLTNPDLCTSALRFDQDNFYFSGLLEPNTVRGRITVRTLKLENQTTNSNGTKIADFVIRAEDQANSSVVQAKVRAIFRPLGNGVSECHESLSMKEACVQTGGVWIDSQARCNICEQLGGIWTNSQCIFGGTI